MGTLLLLGVCSALGVAVAVLYNRLIRLRNGCENAWSDIDVQLRRRHNLIPNLVETTRGYARHERTALTAVTDARGVAQAASGISAQAGAESALGRAVAGLLAVVEAYPDLKADSGFLQLQRELTATEDAIENARRYYNAIVRDLNTACETIPSNLVAAAFGVGPREYFRLESAAERGAPRVDLRP